MDISDALSEMNKVKFTVDQVSYPDLCSEASDEDRQRLTSALEVCHLTSVSSRYGDSVRANW